MPVHMKTISRQQAAFLEFELQSSDTRRQKVALQQCCQLYDAGFRFRPEDKVKFEYLIAGLTVNSLDRKVVRWCLNVIARFGTVQNTRNSVLHALTTYDQDTEIIASAVSSLAALYRGQLPQIRQLNDVPPEVKLLASLQTVAPNLLNFKDVSINIDKSDNETLKLALVTVGLNKDIEHLLHPRYPNRQIIKSLSNHDDSIIRQYCVWAILQNDTLDLNDLGISLHDFEKQPGNVQSKLLQLGASSLEDLVERQDLIIKGSNSNILDAREGLARGIRNSFYDGLPEVTLQWFDTESAEIIRLELSEHFARFSRESPTYYSHALEIAQQSREYKERVLLGAEGRPLYAAIRALEDSGTIDLFGDSLDGSLIAPVTKVGKMIMKVLVLNATPDDQTRLRVDKEAAQLKEQLQKVKNPTQNLEVIHCFATRLDQIQEEILNNKPDIIHFSGHGSVGELFFEDRQGNSVTLSSERLGDILKVHGGIECVLLNACFSEGMAQACLDHVSAVVGTTDTINDTAATNFTRGFYQSLAHGKDYHDAFQMGQLEVKFADAVEAQKYVFIKGKV